jgi:hypothetical protein
MAMVSRGLGAARSEVVRRAEFETTRTNVTVGAVLKRQIGRSRAVAGEPRGLAITEVSTNVVRGLEEKGGGFAGARGPISRAEAITISLPGFARGSLIDARAGQFGGLSSQLGGVPVFVLAPKDGSIVLFEAGFEPRGVSFR